MTGPIRTALCVRKGGFVFRAQVDGLAAKEKTLEEDVLAKL
jgi:hypothetical protein